MTEIVDKNNKIADFAKNMGLTEKELREKLVKSGVDLELNQENIDDLLINFKQQNESATTNVGKKIVLQRSKTQEIKITRNSGQKSTVKVVHKRQHTYVKREKPVVPTLVEPQTSINPQSEILSSSNTEVGQTESIVSESKKIKQDPKNTAAVLPNKINKPAEGLQPKDKKEEPKEVHKEIKEHRTQDYKRRKKELDGEDKLEKELEKIKGKKDKSGHITVEEISRKHAFSKPVKPTVYEVNIPENITIAELAQKMSIKATALIKAALQMGQMVTINQMIDQDTAQILVEELGHKAKLYTEDDSEINLLNFGLDSNTDNYESITRPPVITVMGHVDHGKTSLLDFIRKTKVTAGEAGGITQHIGAYSVNIAKGKMTFLDTPGHSAFTAMRARGAKCTDIVVLVVAADDGVKPQTIEAINHAKAAKVPIIVAVNKMDKPEADVEKVKQELAQHAVLSEDWGGDSIFVPVSAKTGAGIDDLLEAILLQSEVLELKAPAKGTASGVVIESRLDKGRGPIATVLVQSGQLKAGDIMLAGVEYGRIRAMLDEHGHKQLKAGPSMPVAILGLSSTPKAGDDFVVLSDERRAREVASIRGKKLRYQRIARQQASKLDGFMSKIENSGSDQKILHLLIKADVQGSAEALVESLNQLNNSQNDVKIVTVSHGVGGISESDINLALASSAIIIGFNVRADATAKRLAQQEGLSLNYFSIIYDVINHVKATVSGLIGPQFKDQIIGTAEVRDVFRSAKIGAIAGCMVIDGLIKRGNPIRVLRDQVVIYEGELESLRRFKEDVHEVKKGTECGIGVKDYDDVRAKDQIEVYERVEIKSKIE